MKILVTTSNFDRIAQDIARAAKKKFPGKYTDWELKHEVFPWLSKYISKNYVAGDLREKLEDAIEVLL